MTDTQIFHDSPVDRAFRAKRFSGRLAVYTLLALWAVICLFPIYWTLTTSFKMAPDVMKGNMIPWVDFTPKWLGWKSLGLSPDTLGDDNTVRAEFLKRFTNSAIVSVVSSVLAVVLSRFNYKFLWMRNGDISFFFLSQLILPPVVLALPMLVLYKELALLDTRIGLILLYTLSVLPIVVWIMRDQFSSIPTELEEAALVDGLSIGGA
ncbi:MAG: sugar ABC transporter permease, partial [Rhodobacteraceae bacterium PARR1]